jgi:hypothetical protein
MDSDDEMNRKQPATETKNSSDKSLFVTPDGNTNKGTTAGIAPSYAGFTTADDNPILITPKLIKHKKILTLQEINPPNPLGKNNSMSSTITTNVIPFNRNTYEGDTNIPSSPDGNSPSKDSVPATPVDQILNSNRQKIALEPELEPLRPLIMSQHEVFTPHFIELGNISLAQSKTIKKKKESYNLLKENKKIPRSLRIKCELTTSPSFSSDVDFIEARDALKDIVSDFIKKGTEVMIHWAHKNIQLLLKERCHSILRKALQILDCIASYHADIIGPPNWPSAGKKYVTLFLFKLYFSDIFFNHQDLLSFLDLPQDTIVVIGAKILTLENSDDEALNIYESMNIQELDSNDETGYGFVAETLNLFDRILKTATISLWIHNTALDRQAAAVNNLKAKLTAFETISATKATAMAIAKATEDLTNQSSQDEYKDLRITNLEKNFKKYEQKTNEIANKLKTTHKIKGQKNYNGDHPAESMDISPPSTLPPHKYQKLVDLTNDHDEEMHLTATDSLNIPQPIPRKGNQKRHQKQAHSPPIKRRSIQWKNAEVKQYNPEFPAANSAQTLTSQAQSMANSNLNQQHTPLFFSRATPPVPLLAPAPNPFTHIPMNPSNGPLHGLTSQLHPQGVAYSYPPPVNPFTSGTSQNHPQKIGQTHPQTKPTRSNQKSVKRRN